jgi:hypothetical protein
MDMYITTEREISAVNRFENDIKRYRALNAGLPEDKFLDDYEKERNGNVQKLESFLREKNLLQIANTMKRSWRYADMTELFRLMELYKNNQIKKTLFLRMAFGNYCLHEKVIAIFKEK